MTSSPTPRRAIVRTLLLALAATWFLLAAFMRTQDDSVAEFIGLVQRLAFGLALVAVGLLDWQRFRWWWLLIAILVVAVIWTATGHPLFFLFGTI
jgi:hypothetical protein